MAAIHVDADEAPLDRALACKEHGNKRLAVRDAAGALRFYLQGLEHFPPEDEGGGGYPVVSSTTSKSRPLPHQEVVAQLHANSAAALIKQRRWLEAIEHCNAALRHDPAYVKAAWRGATAAIEVGMHAVAVSFVDNALQESPGCVELLELRKRLGPLPDDQNGGCDSSDDTIEIKPWAKPPTSTAAAPVPRPTPAPDKEKAD
mmetsp:Transcript_111788/g.216597  ORF Transcript_111788/g.216597 Transcript_111788/m.216597 type:complete len:202 (+) Transcript_111788:39-644(+)